MGIDDYPIGMYFVNNELKADNLLVYIDRAGYGVSEDTTIPQTVERVVELNWQISLKIFYINCQMRRPKITEQQELGIYPSSFTF